MRRKFVESIRTFNFAIAILVGLVSAICGEEPAPPAADARTREIFVPFEDLNVLLEGPDQRVLLTRKEYDELLAKAKLSPDQEKVPRTRVVLSADYNGVVDEGRATIQGVLILELLAKDLVAVPLSLQGMSLRSATLDDKPAPLGKSKEGLPTLFVQGLGRHELKLDMIVPLQTSAAQQAMSVQLPFPASTRFRLSVPGNVDVKSGAQVISRVVDAAANVTRFELLPQRDRTTIVMSLNNRILLQQRVILARSVLIDELTQSYDKLHATVSLAIPHGAVDRFRFALPAGFEVTDVTTPLLARWAVEHGEGDSRVLDVLLREATREPVVLSIVAVNHTPQLEKWTMPQLRPLDVASHAAIVGLLAEDRLAITSIAPTGLIPIDTTILNSALPPSVLQPEPGAPRLRPVAAFYSPQTDFQLQASYRRSDARVEVTSNLLFTINDRQLQLRGGFALKPLVEPLFIAEIAIPANWQVSAVTQNDGANLPFELFAGENNTSRLQIRLPHGAPPGQFFNLFVHAHTTPAGWLSEWSQTSVTLPGFAISGAARDVGAVAVQTHDDLLARPDQLTGLTPLDEKEKGDFGLGGTPTSLAYRYESQPYSAKLTVERPEPRLTARTFSFLRLEPEGLLAHYELLYHIDHARARRLTLRLPASTPDALSIRGIDVLVKEFRSEIVDGERQWVVELAEPKSGAVRLAVDFQQTLPADVRSTSQTTGTAGTSQLPLPIVRAANVIYQSGTFAVEGNMEFDIQVKSDARKVDVGELVDAEYQVGKRLLGAFGFVGDPGVVLATIARRPEFGLPSAIVQRAELVTALSAQGLTQTAARFQLRTKAPFLEIGLPANSTLWSATIGDQPAAPQRDGDRLLVSLSTGGANDLRDLKLVYETPVAAWSRWGEISTDAPHLFLRDETGANRAEVPLADLSWHLILPDGQRVVRSSGSVFVTSKATPRSPALVAVNEVAGYLEWATTSTQLRTLTDTRKNTVKNWLPSKDVESASEGAEGYGRGDRPMALPAAPATATPPMDAEARDALAPQTNEAMPMFRGAPESARTRVFTDGTHSTAGGLGMPAPVRAAMPGGGAQVGGGGQPPGPAQQTQAFPPQVVPPPTAEPQAPIQAKDAYWALQGMRSLPVELARAGTEVTFQSLGVQPRLQVTLANSYSLNFLTAFVALVVAIVGLRKSNDSVGSKCWFVILAGAALLAIPLIIGLFTEYELTDVFAPAFYVVCWLVVWYLALGTARWVARHGARLFRRRAVATAVVSLALVSTANGQEPSTLENLRHLLAPTPPVKIPADAVVIPYNADDPLGPKTATKVFVPYSEYVKLWNRAFPDKPLTAKQPVTPFAIGGTIYTTTLDGTEFLVVTGRMEVEVFAEGIHQIPLPIVGAVLTKVTLDGQAARMQVIQPAPEVNQPAAQPANANPAPNQQATAPQAPPAESIPVVLVEGIGRKKLEFDLRFKLTRSGGWRIVSGRLPAASAAALDLVVPAAKTEIRLGSAMQNVANAEQHDTGHVDEFESQQDQQTIRTAIPSDGQLNLQWRPKVAESQVDQSLTARSTAILDIQEDALRLTWQVDLTFRRGLRDTFTFTVPADMLLEKVLGNNVRGWKSAVEGATAKVDVTLLKSATGSERLTLLLSKRAAVGAGDMAAFIAPAVTVNDAALHQGVLVVRRSPMLDVRVDNVAGLNRADANEQEVAAVLANVTDDSPLGIKLFQTYRFVSTPFTLRLAATSYPADTTVEVQSLLRIAERENQYEARLNFTVENRPRFSVQCRLPAGFQVDEVTGPGKLDWNVATIDQRDVLSVFLPNGQQQFSIVIRGRLPRANAATFPIPKIEVLDVNRQTGQVVVQADPAYVVQAEQLQACQDMQLEQVFGWLNENQRRMARFAISYRTPDFNATVRVTAKTPEVKAFTITNSRVTPFAVEDTLFLQYAISGAGIRSVSFLLPAEMRDARITAPLLRQKTIEPIADQPNRVRVKLELQDEVTEQFIVAVEHDRALTGNTFESPIPVIENATTEHRFVVLENVGRDELVVSTANQITELNRQQTQWNKLAETLGDSIMRAYVVRDDATDPRLAVQTKRRATVETAGARIGLAQTLLVVDGSGAYRGIQEYFIDNKTEQYLEIELPAGAELWTAQVAGEPVKPVVAANATTGTVFIPIIKSASGDLDYRVELKYGGQIELPRRPSKVSFPLMHTKNIRVELSHVRLQLPETRHWLDFGGSMRYVPNQAKLEAGYKSYQSKQIKDLLDVYQEGEAFSKMRAANNLKQLGLSIRNSTQTDQRFRFDSDFEREFNSNTALLQQAEQVLQVPEKAPQEAAAGDNRYLLLLKCSTQPLTRSKNVVSQLADNFDATAVQTSPTEAAKPGTEGKEGQKFNLNWLEGNRLKVTDGKAGDKSEKLDKGRVEFDEDSKARESKSAGNNKGAATQAANDLGRKLAEDASKEAPADAKPQAADDTRTYFERSQQRGGELNKQAERYNMRLEQQLQQQQQLGNQPANATALPAGRPGSSSGESVDPLYQQQAQTQQSQTAEPFGAIADRSGRQPTSGMLGERAVAYSGLASLDVTIPQRGVEYMFVTPRGEIAIDAWMMETSQFQRLIPLLAIVCVLGIIGFGARWKRSREG